MIKSIRKEGLAIAVMTMFGVASLPSVAAAASASGLTTVSVVNVYQTYTNVYFDAFPTNACGSGAYKVAGEKPSPTERARIAFLTAALLSGKLVWAQGNGVCDGVMEELALVGLYK